MAIKAVGRHFRDEQGRVLHLRGVNLGGSTKLPTRPDGRTHLREGFFNHRDVSFVGRPFPLAEADEHFQRLASWGLTFLRFLVTWEAIEHAGPGQYDTAYLDYLEAVIDKAGEYGMTVFIDPHQDVWSRFTGGDGAPGWTLEAVGFDMTRFRETEAAIVHQIYGDPFPRMVWPTNYNRLAAATMFTLFFAGDVFAPHTKIDGVGAQDYLQGHYLRAMQQVARRLKAKPQVIGYDTLNEPHRGFIGSKNIAQNEVRIKLGLVPTPYQAMLLGSGYPQTVEEWTLKASGLAPIGEQRVAPKGVRAWQDGRECIWRENGVWDIDKVGNPQLLRPDHFASHAFEQFLAQFAERYAAAIRAEHPEALIFIESDALGGTDLTEIKLDGLVYAPHWYDGLTLFTKRYIPFLALDTHTGKRVMGVEAAQRNKAEQIGQHIASGQAAFGEVPTVIGEVGIPFDLNDKAAYKTGDFSAQVAALDSTLCALEANLVNFTLWNYTADNSNAYGDGWNNEDLSLFSRDQQHNPADINSGGRALAALLRPYARAIAGEPLRMSYDVATGNFEFTFKHDSSISAPTEFYVPRYAYPQGYSVTVSDGETERDEANQRLVWRHSGKDMPHFIRISPAVPRQAPAAKPDAPPAWLRIVLVLLLVAGIRQLFRRRK